MPVFNYWKSILVIIYTILFVFVGTSLFDVVLSVLSARFYSTAAFIVIFGVGGVFAGIGAYQAGIEKTPTKSATAKWVIIALILTIGLIFLFVLSRLEGGEYEAPFKAFGITMALSTILFITGKTE